MDIQIRTDMQFIINYSPTQSTHARTIFRIRTYMYPLVMSLMYVPYVCTSYTVLVSSYSVGIGGLLLRRNSDRHGTGELQEGKNI